ncbi:CST complex subunit TEN1 [Electrophorus electricus]|uniref:CST complex subunit TEN1 n=1 Tax=Electrophorus electricus TaxID=8005 RepID=UPI0015D057E9|nr:CST complex subunit TEN1 [Electrophorus electricus]
MLPAHATFYFPWEIRTDAIKDGTSLRTFGRLASYLPEESRAVLTCVRASVQHQVSVRTTFVEPFHPVIGAQYIVLGETEKAEGGDAILHARVLTCVDGVDVALLQKAVDEQRSFFKDRDGPGPE